MQLTFIDPGQLRTEVMLKKPIETPDDNGGFALSYQDVGMLWVSFDAVNRRSETFGARSIDEASHKIIARFRDDIKPGYRITRGSTNYTVQMVNDLDNSGRYLSCFILEDRQ